MERNVESLFFMTCPKGNRINNSNKTVFVIESTNFYLHKMKQKENNRIR